MYRALDVAGCLQHILDPSLPFRIFFCVREVGKVGFHIKHPGPSPYHLLYLPEIGDLDLRCDGAEHRVSVGELLWMQPNSVFDLRACSDEPKINISVCRFDLDLDHPVGLDRPFAVSNVKPRALLLNDLLPGSRVDESVENLRARSIIGHIIGDAFLPRTELETGRQGGLSMQMRKACMDYIQQHIHQRIIIAEVAAHVGLNPDYFARQFKKSFGVSPQSWIKTIRIREAADHLLSGSNSISAIAEQFGFKNVYFFSRQFREVMGVSPRKWLRAQEQH